MIMPPKTYAVRRLSERGWEWVNAIGRIGRESGQQYLERLHEALIAAEAARNAQGNREAK